MRRLIAVGLLLFYKTITKMEFFGYWLKFKYIFPECRLCKRPVELVVKRKYKYFCVSCNNAAIEADYWIDHLGV